VNIGNIDKYSCCLQHGSVRRWRASGKTFGVQRLLSTQCRSCGAGSSYIWLLGLCWRPCWLLMSDDDGTQRNATQHEPSRYESHRVRCLKGFFFLLIVLGVVLDPAYIVGYCVGEATATLSAGFQTALTHGAGHMTSFLGGGIIM